MKRVDVVYSLLTNPSKSKVLAVKNVGRSSWSLPGGAVEAGESWEQAAIREAQEETGLDVSVHGIVAINECKFEEIQEHAIFITFRAEIVGGEKGYQDQMKSLRWHGWILHRQMSSCRTTRAALKAYLMAMRLHISTKVTSDVLDVVYKWEANR